MNDDSFHLTPVDIRNQEFRTTFRGYDPADVDDFRNRVAEAFERVLRERAALDERSMNYREQLKAFREREKAMNEALVAAQQLREDAEKIAARKMETVLQEARVEADRILAEARSMEANLRRDSAAGQRQFSAYLSGFRALLERQLSEVEALEARERDSQFPEHK